MFRKKKKPGSGDSPWGGGGSTGGEDFWGVASAVPDAPPEKGAAPSVSPPPQELDTLRPEKLGAPRNMADLVEPVFLYVCGSHRLVREGQELRYAVVRREVEKLLEDLEKRARLNTVIQQQFEKLREPILWYLDYWFGSSGEFPSLQREWNQNRMGEEPEGESRGVLTGDEAFFDDPTCGLDATLRLEANDELANDRLTFFYTAIGTGFCGPYFQPIPEHEDKLRQYMTDIYPRIRQQIEANLKGEVTPECYKYTDKRDFVAPIRDRPMMLACSILCLLMSLLMGYFWLYDGQKKKLEDAVDNVLQTRKMKE